LKILKNILIGFLVSFIGSIPLGYLNLIGFEIYRNSSLIKLIYYLLGVLIIEALVIYATLYFAHKLNLNPKWRRLISFFSIIFLLFLTYYFYAKTHYSQERDTSFQSFLKYPAFITGFILSSLNFAQVPFWLSWNLYLVNEKYISEINNWKMLYLLGTLLGTFLGMLLLILSINMVSNSGWINQNSLSQNIWILFLLLAIFQIFQFIRKK
jgi:threonine/homoserine/homoserine lactone efflux protein